MYVETGEPVEIVARHQDAEQEYFTIRLPDGREKQTEAARLRLPKGSRALEEELALVSQVRPPTTAIFSVLALLASGWRALVLESLLLLVFTVLESSQNG